MQTPVSSSADHKWKNILLASTGFALSVVFFAEADIGIFKAQVVEEPTPEVEETNSGSLAKPEPEVEAFTVESFQERAIRLQWENRLQESKDFRNEVLQKKTLIASYRAQNIQQMSKRNENRRLCTKKLETASSYSRFRLILECYREELILALERLEKERDYVASIPGVTDDVRWLTLTRTDLLTDAMAVVITAIDSELYESEEEIAEVKQNLMRNYWEPRWLMMTRLRADKARSWIESITTRIATVTEEEELSNETMNIIIDALVCLEQAETSLRAVVDSQVVQVAQIRLTEAHDEIRHCVQMLRHAHSQHMNLMEAEEVEEIIEPEPVVDPTAGLSRRLRRRLGDEFRIDTIDSTATSSSSSQSSSSSVEESTQAPTEFEMLSRRLRRRLEGQEHTVYGE